MGKYVNKPLLDALEQVESLSKDKDDLLEMLLESKMQIEYLHEKFRVTGSGESVLSRIKTITRKIKA